MLGASPLEMGLLSAASGLPVLLFGVAAGVWVDRLRRRPLMIAADLGRAGLLALIPLAAVLGVLRIELLYVIVVLAGLLGVIFNTAYRAYLPGLVARDHLVEGNSKLAVSASGRRNRRLGPGRGIGAGDQRAVCHAAGCAHLPGFRRFAGADPPARTTARTGYSRCIFWT